MTNTIWILAIAVAFVVGSITTGTIVFADDDDDDKGKDKDQFKAKLKGSMEVPAISTSASGTFKAKLSKDGNSLSYKLKFKNLEEEMREAHIHFGQKGVNGGVSIFLCTNVGGDPSGLAPSCPTTSSGMISGTLTAANVIGPIDQGIDGGEFDEVISALQNGLAYINVHSDEFRSGEIRGQVRD